MGIVSIQKKLKIKKFTGLVKNDRIRNDRVTSVQVRNDPVRNYCGLEMIVNR